MLKQVGEVIQPTMASYMARSILDTGDSTVEKRDKPMTPRSLYSRGGTKTDKQMTKDLI